MVVRWREDNGEIWRNFVAYTEQHTICRTFASRFKQDNLVTILGLNLRAKSLVLRCIASHVTSGQIAPKAVRATAYARAIRTGSGIVEIEASGATFCSLLDFFAATNRLPTLEGRERDLPTGEVIRTCELRRLHLGATTEQKLKPAAGVIENHWRFC